MTSHETALATRRAPQPAPAPQTQLWQLPYEHASVRDARHLVRDHLALWGLGDLTDTAVLVVSELVTNAVRTGCRLRMELTVDLIAGIAVRIGVRDGSRAMPVRVVDTDDWAESGRGLAMVHLLTDGRWGAVPESTGKTVWAIVGAPVEQQPPPQTDTPTADTSVPVPTTDLSVRGGPGALPSAADWLIGESGPRAVQARLRWNSGSLAGLPIGRHWDVVRTPAEIGLPLLKELQDDPGHALLGPVLHDRAKHMLMWLVTPGMTDHWPPTANLIRSGLLLCPPPHITATTPCIRVWEHWPDTAAPTPLTPPPWLAAALGPRTAAGLAS
ncbi:ATP-binding protein [Kitasatospora sp. NPDC088134]|uniref:ATP-binding protein n=1 Tax=Kitasatospora sp. NPDC088134 TaxID=3364071 RepID=UPI0038245CDC